MVANGLDLEVIVEIDDLLDLRLGTVFENGTEQFTRLTRRANDQALAVLFQNGLGNTRETLEIVQIAIRDQLVKVLQSRSILNENDLVIGLEL